MTEPILYIGNKNYSSWSFRAWIGLRAKGVPFREELRRFSDDNLNLHFREFSPTGKVPVLVDGKLTVWESLAILEYAADTHPDKRLWPADRAARAIARSVANEMHAGFVDLRSACPMNMRREVRAIPVSEGVRRDVARIESIWAECLERSGGPFLFGEFCNADAMYAPVVNRLRVYALSSTDAVQRYTRAMSSLDAWREWSEAGAAEPWIVDIDEA